MYTHIKIKNIFVILIVFSTLVPFVDIFPSYSIQALCMMGAASYIALPVLRNPRMTLSSFFMLAFFALWLFLSSSGFTVERVSNYVALISFMLWAIGSSKIYYIEKFPEVYYNNLRHKS